MVSVEGRLARIETKLDEHEKRQDERHADIIKALDPVQDHSKKIAVLEQNGRWIYGVATFMGGVGAALAHYFL